MARPVRSQYIRINKNSTLIKRWIAKLLLSIDLEDYLVFGRIEQRILAAFISVQITPANREDPDFIRALLESELANCAVENFDENDVFSMNTRRIKEMTGLNEAELSILRFAVILNCSRPLEMVADVHSDHLSAIDLCDVLHDVLGESFDALYSALSPTGRLVRSGLLKQRSERGGTGSLSGWLRVPDVLRQQIFRAHKSDTSLERMFYVPAARSSLAFKDFRHLEPTVSLIRKYLKASYKARDKGVNILLWGPPGTGKTELARYLAQSVRKQGLEINTDNETGHPLGSQARFESYRLCQAIVGNSKHALEIYDEVEDILCDHSYADHGFKRSGVLTKASINNAIENNGSPAIWITNTLRGVDPAYLRRFDLILRVKRPGTGSLKRIAKKTLKDLPVDNLLVDQIALHRAITPAHLHKVSRICARLGIDSRPEARSVVQQVLNSDLEAIHAAPLQQQDNTTTSTNRLAYKPGLINSDLDLGQLGRYLGPASSARICLYGPPGTGKTAWGHYLARSVKRPLLVKRAADILDSYIGITEKNIVSAFEEAAVSRSVLMLDEVDSFLQDRSKAQRHWEVAQVNQFLTAMEHYDGILICTTNLMHSLDPATIRRFDFKVGFDYLTTGQAVKMAINLLMALSVKVAPRERKALHACLANLKLSHGDFATLFRRYSVLKAMPDAETLIADLRVETGFRSKEASRAIGFMANA